MDHMDHMAPRISPQVTSNKRRACHLVLHLGSTWHMWHHRQCAQCQLQAQKRHVNQAIVIIPRDLHHPSPILWPLSTTVYKTNNTWVPQGMATSVVGNMITIKESINHLIGKQIEAISVMWALPTPIQAPCTSQHCTATCPNAGS